MRSPSSTKLARKPPRRTPCPLIVRLAPLKHPERAIRTRGGHWWGSVRRLNAGAGCGGKADRISRHFTLTIMLMRTRTQLGNVLSHVKQNDALVCALVADSRVFAGRVLRISASRTTTLSGHRDITITGPMAFRYRVYQCQAANALLRSSLQASEKSLGLHCRP